MPKIRPAIVITGAAGFIGSALAWRLNQLGRADLLLVDNLRSSAKWRNLVPLAYLDYMEKDDFLASLRQGGPAGYEVEAILHMGACSATTEADVTYLARNNFEYSKRLAEFCLDRPSPIRLIYASSAATYGEGEQGYRDDHALVPSLRPLNAYGYSKQMFDQWNLRHGHIDKVVGIKFFNVYGPNEYHKGDMRSMVAKAFDQIQSAGRVQLFKSHRPDYRDGEQVRDFVYVKDAVDMTLHFLDTRVEGGLYNVGSGQARSWLDMMKALFAALERDPRIDFVPMPEVLRGKYQYHTLADLSKIRAAGYDKPVRSLEDGVSDYAAYLKAGRKPLGWEWRKKE